MTEEGTTAAGATASVLVRGGHEQEEFIVNRPFVYVIHDSCNNMVLFQGRFYGNLKTWNKMVNVQGRFYGNLKTWNNMVLLGNPSPQKAFITSNIHRR